jgi:hypothetical protein
LQSFVWEIRQYLGFSSAQLRPIITARSWFRLIIVACLFFGYFSSSRDWYTCGRPQGDGLKAILINVAAAVGKFSRTRKRIVII